MKTKKKSNFLKNFIVFVLLIFLTFYILFKDQNVLDIFEILKSVKLPFVMMAIGCMFLYLVLEAVNLGRTLKNLNCLINRSKSINPNNKAF